MPHMRAIPQRRPGVRVEVGLLWLSADTRPRDHSLPEVRREGGGVRAADRNPAGILVWGAHMNPIIEAAAKAHWTSMIARYHALYPDGHKFPSFDELSEDTINGLMTDMRAALRAMAKCEPTDRMFEIWSDGLNLLDKNARRDCADEWRALLLAAAEEE